MSERKTIINTVREKLSSAGYAILRPRLHRSLPENRDLFVLQATSVGFVLGAAPVGVSFIGEGMNYVSEMIGISPYMPSEFSVLNQYPLEIIALTTALGIGISSYLALMERRTPTV